MRFKFKTAKVRATKARFVRSILVLGVAACCLSAQRPPEQFTITPDIRSMLDRVSGESMRGHLSFIASDALEGRNTPSQGLDIAAEYIAAQFRRAGLEPGGDDGYFQTANFLLSETPMDAFELKLKAGSESIGISKNQVSFNIDKELNLSSAMVKVDYADQSAVGALTTEQVGGKVVITEIPDSRRAEGDRRLEMFMARQQFLNKMTAMKVALVLSIDRLSARGSGAATGRLIDPEDRRSRDSTPGHAGDNDPRFASREAVRRSKTRANCGRDITQVACPNRAAGALAKCYRCVARLGCGSERHLRPVVSAS